MPTFWAFRENRDPRSGVVLVVTAGIGALLVLVMAAFVQAVRSTRSFSTAQVASAQDGISLRSGEEYALARLARQPLSLVQGMVSGARGDSWCTRPAYDHGEAWADADADAVWDAGEPWADRDGDGARGAWSGRLRSGMPLFSLGIHAAGLSVNDVDQTATASMFNLLGAVLAERMGSPSAFGAFEAPAPFGDPIFYSDLGDRLIANRPPGGYRSSDQVCQILGLTAAESAYLGSMIRLSGDVNPTSIAAANATGLLFLNGMREEILEAFWRYRLSYGASRSRPLPPLTPPDAHTGLPCGPVTIIAREEARALAGVLSKHFQGGFCFQTWQDFYDLIDASRDEIFPNPLPSPAKEGYQDVRLDAVFHAAQPNPYPYVTPNPSVVPPPPAPSYLLWGGIRALIAPWSWGRWPNAREERMIGNADQLIPPPPVPHGSAYTGMAPYGVGLMPGAAPSLKFLLGSPTVFRVDAVSLAKAAQRSNGRSTMDLEVFRTAYLTSQEDFENLTAAPPPHGSGAPRKLKWMDEGVEVRGRPLERIPGSGVREAQSLPMFDQEAFNSSGGGYSRTLGALSPAEELMKPLPAGKTKVTLQSGQQATVPDLLHADNTTLRMMPVTLPDGAAPLTRKMPNELTNFGINGQGSTFLPFWCWTKSRKTGLTQNGRWDFSGSVGGARVFPGEDQVAPWTFGSSFQDCVVREFRQGTIECWVAEGSDGLLGQYDEIWALRVVPSGMFPPPPPTIDPVEIAGAMRANPPEMGLKLQRVRTAPGTWEYQVVWYGPWPKIVGGVLTGGYYATDFNQPDAQVAIRAVPSPPGLGPTHSRFRHVALLLRNAGVWSAGDGMQLYIDGECRDNATERWKSIYPVPLRWNTTSTFVGLLKDPFNPNSPHPDHEKIWLMPFLGENNNARIDQIHTLQLTVQGVGDLQIHQRRLDVPAGEVAARQTSRFLPTARYRSPRYHLPRLDGKVAAKPVLALCTGILPKDPAANPPSLVPGYSMQVELTAYDDLGNPLPGYPAALPVAQTILLPQIPAAADSFDFEILWERAGAARRIDPPVFEDLQVQYLLGAPRRIR